MPDKGLYIAMNSTRLYSYVSAQFRGRAVSQQEIDWCVLNRLYIEYGEAVGANDWKDYEITIDFDKLRVDMNHDTRSIDALNLYTFLLLQGVYMKPWEWIPEIDDKGFEFYYNTELGMLFYFDSRHKKFDFEFGSKRIKDLIPSRYGKVIVV